MKIGGKKIDSQPSSEILVFPREGGDIAFKAVAVMDRVEFDRICPSPEPPMKLVKGGNTIPNFEDPRYAVTMQQYNKRYMDWMFITSLMGAPEKLGDPDIEIEWDTVDRHDPSTWANYEQDLANSGFNHLERMRIQNLVFSVNSLNDSKLSEARESFLQLQREASVRSSSPTAARNGTQSGEPVNGSESDLPELKPVTTSSTKP